MATKTATKPTNGKPTTKPTKETALQGATAGGALDMFKGSDEALIPLVEGGFASPYVQFYHPNAKNARNIIGALGNIEEGTPVYVNGQEFTHLDPFKFILCPMYYQYFADFDSDGKPTEVYLPSMKYPRDFKECINAVILVIQDDGNITPARCRFMGPKCPACRTAVHAITDDVKNVDWVGKSKEHAATKKSGLPDWTWATVEVTVTREMPKTTHRVDKNTGKKVKSQPYDLANGTVVPSSVIDLVNLSKLNKSEEFKATMQACIDDHNKNIEELKACIPA